MPRNNPMQAMDPARRKLHTIPATRANRYRAALRMAEKIANDPWLTEEQRHEVAAIVMAGGGDRA